MPPCSPNHDPVSQQKMLFSKPVFRAGLKNPNPFSNLEEVKTRNIHVYVGKNYVIITSIKTPTKIFLQILLEFAYYSFFLIHLKLKRQIRSYNPAVPSKTLHDSRPKSANSDYTRFQTETAQKRYPLGRRHTNMVWKREYIFSFPPPPAVFDGTR